jgi:ABC-type uncharacterized transport system substrate-binding protein
MTLKYHRLLVIIRLVSSIRRVLLIKRDSELIAKGCPASLSFEKADLGKIHLCNRSQAHRRF